MLIGARENDFAVFGFDALSRSPVPQSPILLTSEQFHVVNPLGTFFDVTVEHGCVRVQADFMSGLVNVEPLI